MTKVIQLTSGKAEVKNKYSCQVTLDRSTFTIIPRRDARPVPQDGVQETSHLPRGHHFVLSPFFEGGRHPQSRSSCVGLWSGRQRPAPRPPRPTQSPCFLHPVTCLPSQVPIVLWSRQKPGGRSGLRLKPAMRPETPALCLPGFLPLGFGMLSRVCSAPVSSPTIASHLVAAVWGSY